MTPEQIAARVKALERLGSNEAFASADPARRAEELETRRRFARAALQQPTPDTTEATLRVALERLVNSVQDLETVDDDGEAATFLVVPPEPLERARAALQQPAVQPEGGPRQ